MLKLIKLPQLAGAIPTSSPAGSSSAWRSPARSPIKPQVLLLDEPLSALDAKIRVSLREEIRAVQRELGITTIYVTHDQEEALSMSDRIVVMSEGRMEQVGTPFEIYNFPRTRFVASFVGTLNILKGRVLDPKSGRISLDDQEVVTSRGISDAQAGEIRSVALRPEAVAIGRNGAGGNQLQGTIEEVAFLGAVVRIRMRLRESAIHFDTFNNPSVPPPERGQSVTVGFSREDILVLEGAPS